MIMIDGKDYDDKVYISDNLHSVELIRMDIWINKLLINPKIAYLVIFPISNFKIIFRNVYCPTIKWTPLLFS